VTTLSVDVALLAGRSVCALSALRTLNKAGLRVGVVWLQSQNAPTFGGVAVETRDDFSTVIQDQAAAAQPVEDASQIPDAVERIGGPPVLSVCFSRRVPIDPTMREPWVNVHPSALPAWRGPDPLFWQLRQGARIIPVSLHAMAQRFDAGKVLARDTVPIEPHDTEVEIDVAVGKLGAELFLHRPLSSQPARVGGGHPGRWHRSPLPDDYRVFPAWTVEHTQRFCRVLQGRGVDFRFPSLNSSGGLIRGRLLNDGDAPNPGEDEARIRLIDGVVRIAVSGG